VGSHAATRLRGAPRTALSSPSDGVPASGPTLPLPADLTWPSNPRDGTPCLHPDGRDRGDSFANRPRLPIAVVICTLRARTHLAGQEVGHHVDDLTAGPYPGAPAASCEPRALVGEALRSLGMEAGGEVQLREAGSRPGGDAPVLIRWGQTDAGP